MEIASVTSCTGYSTVLILPAGWVRMRHIVLWWMIVTDLLVHTLSAVQNPLDLCILVFVRVAQLVHHPRTVTPTLNVPKV